MKKNFKNLPEKVIRVKFKGILKWLSPGMGIKRWVVLGCFGICLVIFGSALLREEEYFIINILDIILVISGILLLVLSIERLIHSLITAFLPSAKNIRLLDILYEKKQLVRGPKVVTVGGGTGLSVLLSGIKDYTSNITAVVTVTDDGGSSGRLRQEFDILPPGDIRNCLVALADAPALMRDLFQFRFDTKSELSGHSFGNLFITVMTQLTGDFEKAIKETSKVLALKGQVIPSTLDNVVLIAEHKDGSITEGEKRIPLSRLPINKISLKPEQPAAAPEAIKAIEEAEIIVLGPGSLYTSIIPNLLIKEITDAIVASDAIKVYVCNIMTQPGETDSFRVSEHIKTIITHSHPRIFDYCIVNTGDVPASMLKRYAEENSYLVVNDIQNIENMGYRVIEDNVVVIDGLIRHNALKLAEIILGLTEEI